VIDEQELTDGREDAEDMKGTKDMTSETENDKGLLASLVGRRKFLIAGGAGAAALAAGGGAAAALIRADGPGKSPRSQTPPGLSGLAGRDPHAIPQDVPVRYLAMVGTDGWATLPYAGLTGDDSTGAGEIGPYFPDPLADPPNRTTYVFSFRNVTGLDREVVAAQKGHTQFNAPLFFSQVGEELWVTLTNLGLQLRPDLVDGHTLHWHGFRNAIPFYDGVPESSISVPIGHDFTYVYRPKDAGTYMYHCHFEDVEHVMMGMQGIVFVKPKVGTTTFPQQAYGTHEGDANGDSQYDREFAILAGEVDVRGHFNDAHIQATDWTDFHAEFSTLNGRSWPETILPNGTRLDTGDLAAQFIPPATPWKSPGVHNLQVAAAGSAADRLASNPNSSLVEANAGERVLIRMVNLGFYDRTFVFPGLEIDVVGRDARFVPATARREKTDSVQVGPGESRDIFITAPDTPGDYPFYDRNMAGYPGSADGSDAWVGGARSLVRVYATGTLATQLKPNGWAGEAAWHGENGLKATIPVPPAVNITASRVSSGPRGQQGRYLVGSVTVDETTTLAELRWMSTNGSGTPSSTDNNWTSNSQNRGPVSFTGAAPNYTVALHQVNNDRGGGQRYFWVRATDADGRVTVAGAGRA
jgi:FtsP/CotA-like multicopper oxidase with cupredoxin domain